MVIPGNSRKYRNIWSVVVKHSHHYFRTHGNKQHVVSNIILFPNQIFRLKQYLVINFCKIECKYFDYM